MSEHQEQKIVTDTIIKKTADIPPSLSILIVGIIFAGVYYMSEANQQASIERQQQLNMEMKQQQANEVASQRSSCATEAAQEAAAYYQTVCASLNDCTKGRYLVGNYNTYYQECLQRAGLE